MVHRQEFVIFPRSDGDGDKIVKIENTRAKIDFRIQNQALPKESLQSYFSPPTINVNTQPIREPQTRGDYKLRARDTLWKLFINSLLEDELTQWFSYNPIPKFWKIYFGKIF